MASKNHDHIKNLPEWHAVKLLVKDRDDHTCQHPGCSSTEHLQVDHVIPLAILFAHGVTPEAIEAALDPDNLVTLCRPHNASKGARVDDVALERVEWVNPLYPELLDIVGTMATDGPVL